MKHDLDGMVLLSSPSKVSFAVVYPVMAIQEDLFPFSSMTKSSCFWGTKNEGKVNLALPLEGAVTWN